MVKTNIKAYCDKDWCHHDVNRQTEVKMVELIQFVLLTLMLLLLLES